MMDDQIKKLYRSKTNRVLGGVCGGIGEYFNIDPVLIRLFFVVFLFAGGSAILAYIILWVVIPEEEGSISKGKVGMDKKPKATKEEFSRSRLIAGVLILAIGTIFLLNNLGLLSWHFWFNLWPLILIFVGLLYLVRGE